MAEMQEGNPSVNIAKTGTAQRERARLAEKPLNLVDRWIGKFVSGSVNSFFNKERGGGVRMHLKSGGAILNQSWEFDKNGQLTSVVLDRTLMGGPSGSDAVSTLVLSRGKDGKFQVMDNKTTSFLPEWQEEFHTAKVRMEAGRNTPPGKK